MERFSTLKHLSTKISEQEALFKEFMDFCYPSVYMNERVFAKYMLNKGLKEEKLEDTLRYIVLSMQSLDLNIKTFPVFNVNIGKISMSIWIVGHLMFTEDSY